MASDWQAVAMRLAMELARVTEHCEDEDCPYAAHFHEPPWCEEDCGKGDKPKVESPAWCWLDWARMEVRDGDA